MRTGNQGIPMRISRWDVLALTSNFLLDTSIAVTRLLQNTTVMLAGHGSYVGRQRLFHEEASQDIENCSRGD